jgi:hypothetical protein
MDLFGWLPWKAARVIDMPSVYCVSRVTASIDVAHPTRFTGSNFPTVQEQSVSSSKKPPGYIEARRDIEGDNLLGQNYRRAALENDLRRAVQRRIPGGRLEMIDSFRCKVHTRRNTIYGEVTPIPVPKGDERMTNQSQWMKQAMQYCDFWSDYDKRKKKGKKLKISQIRYYCQCGSWQIHDAQQNGEVANCSKCGVSTNLRPEKDADGDYKLTLRVNDSYGLSCSYKPK